MAIYHLIPQKFLVLQTKIFAMHVREDHRNSACGLYLVNSNLIMDVMNHNMVRSAKVLVPSCPENADACSCY